VGARGKKEDTSSLSYLITERSNTIISINTERSEASIWRY